jgi:hypothetical protein
MSVFQDNKKGQRWSQVVLGRLLGGGGSPIAFITERSFFRIAILSEGVWSS